MPTNPSPATVFSRRNFLALSGAIPAALAAQSLVGKVVAATASSDGSPAKSVKKYPIGLELYSVRAELARDLPNTLRTVAKMGYEVVEFYAPYFGWTIGSRQGRGLHRSQLLSDSLEACFT